MSIEKELRTKLNYLFNCIEFVVSGACRKFMIATIKNVHKINTQRVFSTCFFFSDEGVEKSINFIKNVKQILCTIQETDELTRL